jgi:hypothetical protein
VIQLVLIGTLPSNPLLRRHCLADPEVLLELAADACRPGVAIDDLSERFSGVLHDLRMGGVWKRTDRRRLPQTEQMLRAHVLPEVGGDLIFLDVGASDGITTVEALRALRKAFGERVLAYAADVNLWLLRYRAGPVTEYRAVDGEPVMVRLGPFGLRLARQRYGLAHRGGDPMAGLYLLCARLRNMMRLDGRISLLNPLTRREPGLFSLEFDCLRQDPRLLKRVTAIRASNVLNLNYFTAEQVCAAVGHLHAYLRDGGCLLVSRNGGARGEAERGSVWIRESSGFRRVDDFGGGSEVASLVDGWRPDRDRNLPASAVAGARAPLGF